MAYSVLTSSLAATSRTGLNFLYPSSLFETFGHQYLKTSILQLEPILASSAPSIAAELSQSSTGNVGRALTDAQKTMKGKPIVISKDPWACPAPGAEPALNMAGQRGSIQAALSTRWDITVISVHYSYSQKCLYSGRPSLRGVSLGNLVKRLKLFRWLPI